MDSGIISTQTAVLKRQLIMGFMPLTTEIEIEQEFFNLNQLGKWSIEIPFQDTRKICKKKILFLIEPQAYIIYMHRAWQNSRMSQFWKLLNFNMA